MNVLAGESPERLLRAIRQWRAREATPEPQPAIASEQPAPPTEATKSVGKAPEPGRGAPAAAARHGDLSAAVQPAAPSGPPAAEGVEAAVHRRGEDAADFIEALDKTLKDAANLRDKLKKRIPADLQDDERVKSFFERFDQLLKKTRETTRLEDLKRLVSTLNDHFRMHRDIERDLGDRVPKDALQAIKILQSTMKATGDALKSAYDRLVHDPLTNTGEKALKPFSKELAQRFRKEMEAQQKALQEVGEGLAKLPT